MTGIVDGITPLPILRKHPLAKCEDCPLYWDGQFVPSDGPVKAKLAFAGEAPGVNEARVGKPFIGESGRLLNTILKHYDIDRRDVLLTNACLCRDPNGATPTAKAIQACRPRLLGELQEREVQDVVALGNSAAQSVLGTRSGVTVLRVGQGRSSEDLPGVRVIPTFHPAACLRVPGFFPSLVNDIGKLRGFHSTWYEPKWRAYESPQEALAAIGELERIPGDVTVDIESEIEKDISFETPTRHKPLCVGLGYQPGKVVVIGETALYDNAVRYRLKNYLTSRKLTGQNLKFDNKGLWAWLHEPLKVNFDVMLASYCLDERAGIHALEYQAIEVLGAPSWKHELDKYRGKGEGYGVVPRPVLYQYNAWDVHATDMLADVRSKQLEEEGLRGLHDFLCRASDQLMFVELNGIGLDLAYNTELMVSYVASLGILETAIAGAIPVNTYKGEEVNWKDFNPRSPLQVKKVVKDTFGLKLPMAMNQKREYAETTNAEALNNLMEQSLGTIAEEFFRRMLEHRKEAKLYGTYVKGLRKRLYRGRVYPTFLLHGTTTGRLSCRNPNLQNIPRDSTMRKQFVPARTEHVFIEGDYGQNELRVLCWLARDEYLRGIFNDPTRDLFDELTPILYGDVSALSPAEKKELRIRVKAYVYGLAYGREARSIAIEFNTPLAEAERGMRQFFNVIPQTVRFREETRRKVLQGEDLVTVFGRHRRFWLITNQNRKDVLNEALAFLPQSTASDICLDAFVHIRPRLKGVGYIRNIVHDSMLAECHEDNVMEVTTIMNEEMLASAARVVGDYVQFRVDFKSGPNWGALT
jgi:DNA polymerase-1